MTNPRDTPIQLRQCVRCRAYVFACEVSGYKVAADPKPLSAEEYRAALIARRGTYDQVDQAGKPWKLKRRIASSQWPPYAGRSVVADHNCGTKAMNTSGVELVDIPQQPRASDTERRGETQGSCASSDSDSKHLARLAPNVIRRRSDRRTVHRECDVCGTWVGDADHWGIEHAGRWVHVEHVDCPKS
jgi:hypothetical protein